MIRIPHKKTDLARAYAAVLPAEPRWLITHGDLAGGTLQAMKCPGLRFCPPLFDRLDWGPQHIDLQIQAEMRRRFFGSSHPLEELPKLDLYCEALGSGDELLFWCDPELPSCLGILWALDGLLTRGADLRHAWLILSPVISTYEPIDETSARFALENRVAVPQVIEPLVAIRRHLASDSDEATADLSPLPPRVREWAAVTHLLADYLPDQRGLDLIDSLLLDALTEEWQRAVPIACGVAVRVPRGHSWGEILAYERLLDLGGYAMFADRPGPGREDGLVEARFRGGREMRFAGVRITELGRQVREGRADALQCRRFSRWVGGRHITNERPLRRSSLPRHADGARPRGEGRGPMPAS